ncbi:MAG TPA: acyl carrier protein [Ruminiclostridium sp.]|nr:acyl carrier protein [Ruminiclostridium sp.]
MDNTVESKLKELIIKNLLMKVSAEDITDETDLVRDFVLDSLQMLRLVWDIEITFGISIQNQDSMVNLVSKYKLLKDYVLERVTE